jgi:phosphoglycolate phosphatase-like HAD superfamily hydrolase
MTRTDHSVSGWSLGLIGVAMLSAALMAAAAAGAQGSAPPHGRRFDGFQPRFNLGQAADGAVCEATRGFDGPVVDEGGRVWNVTCRGWSNTLGYLYVFPGGRARAAEAAWRAGLGGRTDCDPGSAEGSGARVTCKTRAAGLAYVVFRDRSGGGTIAAEGRAPIADALALGMRYLAGATPEPAAVDKAAAAVSQVSTAPVGELSAADGARPPSVESLREAAYALGQAWRFDEAELDFSELAQSGGPETSVTARAEALYNQGLNASNEWRFDKAAIFFGQADDLAGQGDPSLRGLGLNYRAADARNQQDYEGAVALADQAIAARARDASAGGSRTAAGDITIPEVGSADGTERISRADREHLRDVQALEIKATALEALGRPEDARQALLLAARSELDGQLPVSATTRKPLFLGQAAPWLNARIWADLLRLDRGTPREARTEAHFRDAVAYFGSRHPGSLPLAAFFLEQARAESELAGGDKTIEAKAADDYRTAFAIFIDQRGSLADSADLARPYFDFLLRRIGNDPNAHPEDVKNFFNAAQALIAQSSAEAAKRQAATAQAGNDKTAALARALQDTDRRQQVNQAAIRRLNEQGVYQGVEVARLRAEQRDLAGENAKLQGELLEVDPGFTSALHTLVDLDSLRKALRPEEVYVKVFLLAGGGYGMLISPTAAIPYRVDLTRDRAEEIVRTLRLPIDSPGRSKTGRAIHGTYNVALAHELFEDIFGPVSARVLAARHIIYEPDATLIAAPISALVVDDASAGLIKAKLASPKGLDYVGVAWLGAHSYNSIALSASAFYQARIAKPSRAANPFYGYADPVIPDNPADFSSVRPEGHTTAADEELCARYRYSLTLMHPLPDSRTEVSDVAKAVSGGADVDDSAFGQAFTDVGVVRKANLNQYRVIYFATHGLLDDGNPCLKTSLLTSFGGQGSDALLDLDKITTLRLDADMVVLSACNTGSNAHERSTEYAENAGAASGPVGRGKLATPKLGSGGGEALGGLVTSFVEAGARNVVVSNWEVDSVTTARLMIALFKQRGISQAGALAQAERMLMNDPKHSHPYYWAPFTVVGDGDRPMPGV